MSAYLASAHLATDSAWYESSTRRKVLMAFTAGAGLPDIRAMASSRASGESGAAETHGGVLFSDDAEAVKRDVGERRVLRRGAVE